MTPTSSTKTPNPFPNLSESPHARCMHVCRRRNSSRRAGRCAGRQAGRQAALRAATFSSRYYYSPLLTPPPLVRARHLLGERQQPHTCAVAGCVERERERQREKNREVLVGAPTAWAVRPAKSSKPMPCVAGQEVRAGFLLLCHGR